MAANQAESQLRISWHDSAWIPRLNGENVLEYFCQRTNPFYDRTCNNEVVKMQRLDPAQLHLMTGVEYELIHGQDPILYIIRKQYRHSSDQVTFLSLYYILAGIVYQAPDLGSVLNSRLLSTVHNLELAFDEALSYSKYTPSKGYWWDFNDASLDDNAAPKRKQKKSEPSSLFQRFRVDQLLGDFLNKFPPKVIQPRQTGAPDSTSSNAEEITEQGNQGKPISLEPTGSMEPPTSNQPQRGNQPNTIVTKNINNDAPSPSPAQGTPKASTSLADVKPVASPPTKKKKT
ncbi:mediator of RNA polymerase II transcription subunit 6-like isoform X2 [Rhopilema esculentum]|uniref:mediator of RNA polymerase II transcription subunit 6-like isoform X2 n=1 Tax=Rhopilema esculentum TaxID=499914 RepID=UPI0031D5214C